MPAIPDPLVAAPDTYRLLLENDKVRVMEVVLEPGHAAPMHDHPNSHVVYVIDSARLELAFPDGTSSTVDLKAGQTLWMEAGPHETRNAGTTTAHNVVVEIKK